MINTVKYEIALILTQKTYVDLCSIYNLINKKRSFTIFRWNPSFIYTKTIHRQISNESGKPINVEDEQQIFGGYVPWLHYNGYKWTKLSEKEGFMKHLKDPRQAMIPANMFFETEKDFKNWIGQDILENVISDLL